MDERAVNYGILWVYRPRIAKEANMGEKILTILLELWAEQNGLEIQELIITKEEEAS